MSYIYFDEDEMESPENNRLIKGTWHDDIEGQSLCGWAWDRGAEWAESLRREALISFFITGHDAAVEQEREACAKMVDYLTTGCCGNDTHVDDLCGGCFTVFGLAKAIRERGSK